MLQLGLLSFLEFVSDANLPFRLRYSTFVRFEPIFRQALDKPVGEPMLWNPAPLRPTTAAARMRDALLSLRKFNWPSSFTIEEWEASKLVIKHDDFNVTIRNNIRGHEFRNVLSDGFSKTTGLRIDGSKADYDVLSAVTLLVNRRLLSTPVVLEHYCIPDELRSELEMKFDVAFAINDGRTQTAIL